ncbi:MAG: YiiX/YebB-like N1pC/P60 family cysteine hydrolase [Myxococcota bacterium]
MAWLGWWLASSVASAQAPWVLSAEVDRVAAEIRDLPASSCVAALEQAYSDLEALRPARVDPADLAAHGAETAAAVYATQLALRGRLAAWYADGSLDADCLRSVRRADLAGRYLIDYLAGAVPVPAWLSDPAAPFAGPEDLRSGDILVTRATMVSSAGIAHMGRIDGQFSHNALVYVDPNGKQWVVQAYLESGALVEPLEDLLANGVARVVVLRHPDAAFAAEVAARAFDRVRRGPRIDYDADFDYQDHTGLFCSEVPRWAFGALVGRPDTLPIPLALTRFDRAHNDAMFTAMGIPGDVTSAPSDILYDPTLTEVAEWRDADALVGMRHADAAVEAVMHWMEDLHYTIEPQGRHRTTVGFGLFVRRLPLVGLALRHQLHPRGDRAFLVASLALQEVAVAVDEDLEQALAGRAEPLTYVELREVLEQLRVADLARYRADPKTARYHALLVPPG